MKALLLVVIVCTFAAAMVPRHRRDTEDKKEALFCAPSTPCAWAIYKPKSKLIELNITNTYCTCDKGTKCQIYEDDVNSNTYVHRCIAISNSKETHKS